MLQERKTLIKTLTKGFGREQGDFINRVINLTPSPIHPVPVSGGRKVFTADRIKREV